MTLTDSKLRTFATSTPAREAVGVLIATRVAVEVMDARVASIVAPLLEAAQLMTSRSPRDPRPDSVIASERNLYLCRDDEGCKRYYTASMEWPQASGRLYPLRSPAYRDHTRDRPRDRIWRLRHGPDRCRQELIWIDGE